MIDRLTDEQRELVSRHIGVAYKVGRKFAKRSKFAEEEDAIQDAAYGVMCAATRWDSTRNVDFAGYASQRALGAAFDGVREFGAVIKGCRKTRNPFVRPVHVPHSIGNLSEKWHIQCTGSSVFDKACRREWHDRFWAAFRQLDKRSQAVVRGRLAGIEQKLLAEQLGICESMVSKLEKSAAKAIASVVRDRGAEQTPCRNSQAHDANLRNKADSSERTLSATHA